MANTYICAMCNNEYERITPEEEAIREKNELFGDISLDECVIVCDECFNIIMNS